MEPYSLGAIRDLLLASFTANDLRDLFFYTDRAELRPLIHEFGPNDGLDAMVDTALSYCETRGLLPDLLGEVERARPEQYARFKPGLGAARPKAPAPARDVPSRFELPERRGCYADLKKGQVAVLITVLLAGALGAIAYRAAGWHSPIPPTQAPGEVPTEAVVATTGPADTPGASPGPWQPASGLPAHLYAIVVDPSIELYLFAGGPAVAGGVFASEDAGRTWRTTRPGLPATGAGALAFGSGSHPLLYAYLEDGGLYTSTDRGKTWKQIGKTRATCSGCRQRLYVHPADERLMLAIDGDVPRISRDGGQTWARLKDDRGELRANCAALWPKDAAILYLGTPERGVMRSTDGGRTWEPANAGMLDADVTAMAVDPTRAEIVYAGTADGALLRSVDGGKSWSVPGDWPPPGKEAGPIAAITLNRYSPDEVFVLANGAGLARSRDGGKSWEPLDTPPTDRPAEFVDMALSTFPETAVVVITAGQDAWRWTDK